MDPDANIKEQASILASTEPAIEWMCRECLPPAKDDGRSLLISLFQSMIEQRVNAETSSLDSLIRECQARESLVRDCLIEGSDVPTMLKDEVWDYWDDGADLQIRTALGDL